MGKHVLTRKDLSQAIYGPPVAGDRHRAACDRGRSSGLPGRYIRPRLLVGSHDDRRILGSTIAKVDRTVVDYEMKRRVTDDVLVGLAHALGGFAVRQAHHGH